MSKFSFKQLLNIIDMVEREEINTLCVKKNCSEQKHKKEIFQKIKKEVV